MSGRMLLVIAVVVAVVIAVVVGLIVASNPSPGKAESSNSHLGQGETVAESGVVPTVPMFDRQPLEA